MFSEFIRESQRVISSVVHLLISIFSDYFSGHAMESTRIIWLRSLRLFFNFHILLPKNRLVEEKMKHNRERCTWRKTQFSKSKVSLCLENGKGKAWHYYLSCGDSGFHFFPLSLPFLSHWLNGKVISIQDNTGRSFSWWITSLLKLINFFSCKLWTQGWLFFWKIMKSMKRTVFFLMN